MEAGAWWLRPTRKMWPLRSEEVVEASNWEKKEMSQDFLAPESPEALAAIQFTEIRWPHPLTEIQILVPTGARPGPARPAGRLASSPRLGHGAHPSSSGHKASSGRPRLGWPCGGLPFPKASQLSGVLRKPPGSRLGTHVSASTPRHPAFQSDPPAVSPSTITLPPKPDLGIRF